MCTWCATPSGGIIPLALVETIGRVALIVVVGTAALAVIWLAFVEARALFGSDEDPSERKTNCPTCGSRLSVDAETCTYCGEPLGG
jgi:anaerobic selenocysteine-containing dehydrogenase